MDIEPTTVSSIGEHSEQDHQREPEPIRWWRDARWWLVIAPLAMANLLVAVLPSELQGDSWTDLVSGRLIAEHGLPHHNFLTVVAYHQQWVDQQWLGQWILYRLEQLIGTLGLSILSAGGYTAAITLLVIGLFRRGLQPRSATVLGLICCPLINFFAILRVQVFSMVLWLIIIWLVASLDEHPRRAWWLVPLFLVWGNIHGAVLLGIGLVVAWSLGTAIDALRMSRPSSWRAALRCLPWSRVAVALTGLAGLVIPYGFSIIHYYHSTAGNSQFGQFIREWAPEQLGSTDGWLFFLILIGTAIIIGTRWRQLTSYQWLTFIGLAVASFHSTRFVPFFAFFACWLVGELWIHAHPIAKASRWLVPIVVGGTLLLGVQLTAALSQTSAQFNARSASTASGAVPTIARVVRDNPSLQIGADDSAVPDYLLWELPNLAGHIQVDGRLELLDAQQLPTFFAFLYAEGNWKSYLDHDQVVVMHPGVDPTLQKALLGLVNWQVIYRDPTAIVLARDTLASKYLTGSYGQ